MPRQPVKIQRVQNVLLIWLDSNIDNNTTDCQNTMKQLQSVVSDISTYTDGDQCIQFINTITNSKVCMIISDALGQHIVPRVHNMYQVDSIFIFCGNKIWHEEWIQEWPKIKGFFTEILPICEALKQTAQQCEQNAISISFVDTNAGSASSKMSDRLDPSFVYTQILKEILLVIKFEQQHINEFIEYCQEQFADNEKELTNIKLLEREYHDKTPIYWYTCQNFLYPMLNLASRLMNVDIIIPMGFFIDDLHRQIEQLHLEQYGDHSTIEKFTVYRGQCLSKADFKQLKETKGGLLSFNNFLSTSKNRDISMEFADQAAINPDLVGILFIMKIDPSKSTTPFASIGGVSYFQREDEVLFSMQTVFRIHDIQPIGGNNRLFEVSLMLISDNDQDLRTLIDRIREETFLNSTGWYRLGSVLLQMGQFVKAQEVYEVLLGQITNESERGTIYHKLGCIKDDQGEYQEAIKLFEKSLQIYQKTLPPNHLNLAWSYNNIGKVYDSMGDYPKALSSHEKALEIRQQSLPPNHPDLGASYNNIGNVYYSMSDYSKALPWHEKALEIQQQSHPSKYPDLDTSWNNIGMVYYNMANYPKAFSSYEKALAIRQQSLPPNHPALGVSYNNIGSAYYNMRNYPKALASFEKSLEIKQQFLPPNHSGVAKSYNNIGAVYNNMGNYPKALSFHKKALEIIQQSLPPNHLDLVEFYNNMGLVYYNMRDYPEALSSHKKALEIQQQSLPFNHLDLAKSYNNIGLVYNNMGNYPKALSSHEKVLEIKQQSLPSYHPDLGASYNDIGMVYYNMGNSPKALSSYEKAIEIQQRSLSPNDPDLAKSYNNIGTLFQSMGDYSKARSCFEHAVRIGQRSLRTNHPHLQIYRQKLELVKRNCNLYVKMQ